jgi:ABC-type transport system involved in multi-copper enzyme maturation permease subunit
MLPRLVGPVLFHELLVTGRRGRHILLRSLYVLVLLGVLTLLFNEQVGWGMENLWGDWRVSPTQMNKVLRFAGAFFERFMFVQFAVIVLLTPGVTAGAVAEEKERRTLDFLLTTQLRGHEIVLGKLFARLAYMVLLVFAGLPVLSLLFLLGGIPPLLIVGGFAVSLMTLLSIACLSMFNSVVAAKPRTAIFAAYVELAAFFISSLLLQELSDPNTLPLAAVWYCAGNPYLALNKLRAELAASGTLGPGAAAVIWQYLYIHAFLAIGFLASSLLGLRLWYRWQASQGSHRAFIVFRRARRLAAVGSRPVFWKEVYAEPFLRVKRGGKILLTSLWFVSLVSGAILLGGLIFIHFTCLALANGYYDTSFSEGISNTIRRLTVVIGCFSVLGAAIHAAGMFAGERDRHTLESLLATPLTNAAIVWGKWWGCFLSVRKAWYLLAAIWVVGVITEVLSPLVVPVLLLACAVYVAFAASLGMWYSLVCRTTLRAMVWTLAVLVIAGGGHQLFTWMLRPLLDPPNRFGGPQSVLRQLIRSPVEVIEDIQDQAFTPPNVLNRLSSLDRPTPRGSDPPPLLPVTDDMSRYRSREVQFDPRLCALGLIAYAGAAALLQVKIQRRFPRAVRRLPFPFPLSHPLSKNP